MDSANAGVLYVKCETNSFCNTKFMVSLFDSKDNLIFTKPVNNMKRVRFDIQYKDKYQIRVRGNSHFSPAVAYRWVEIDPCESCSQHFMFLMNYHPRKTVKVTFNLSDANYHNLPISQGVIICHNIQLP